MFTSASARCLDGGDVDLLHRHHRLEGTLGLTANSRKRPGKGSRAAYARDRQRVQVRFQSGDDFNITVAKIE